jgi:DNA-binding NtrC family response regulator
MNPGSEKKILLIVHDGEMRSLLKDFLQEEGYEVESAEDGRAAFHKLARVYFRLIVTDIRMPGLSGWELLPRLKMIQPWASVVAIPAFGLRDGQRKLLERETSAYLEKPLRLPELKALIQRIISGPETTEDPMADKSLQPKLAY